MIRSMRRRGDDGYGRLATTVLIITCAGLACSQGEGGGTLYLSPYLQNVTPTSITVMWETTGFVVGTVEFGERDRFDRDAADSEARTIHEVGLSGFPNAETLNLTMSYVDVGLIGHRVQTRKGPV